MRVIKARMKGKEPKLVSDERPRDSNVIDLMERLRESLGQVGEQRPREEECGEPRRGRLQVRARKQRPKGHAASA